MKLVYVPLLIAALSLAGSAYAAQENAALTPSARQLLDLAGFGQETYSAATRTCKRSTATVAGVAGLIAVDSGSYDCGGNHANDRIGARTTLRISFDANIPVTKCVSFEDAEAFLIRHGWSTVSDEFVPSTGPSGVSPIDIIPVTRDFIDGAGATLTVVPWLRHTCLTRATLKITDHPNAR